MTMDREKEREVELEFAMLTNCLLLGVDPGIIGITNGMPKTGLFRHSNVRMGEYLLHFILSALRGPVQAAKDFDKVWPICDSAQSRDFRKIVQGIINELESQGALPRSNSRVSSLATCCGQRFVELLWQLSVHALREVHKRTYPADVATNPLPSPLTDLSQNHAATLLPVTKARIALERRKFLKNATEAVHRQGTWSALAHDITAEYRGLCAEEAYLQQELEKIHDLRNKAKLEGEIDGRVSSSVDQSSHLVLKATRLWDSLLARKNQHEILASGPIEDLIAHREHRYRISGSSLLAAVDQSRQVSNSDNLSGQSSDTTRRLGDQELLPNSIREALPLEKNEAVLRPDDKASKAPVVDVAEILRCWTHALQRIHKQSLLLAKANDGDGPELLRSSTGSGTSGHAESLASTLEEHHQHLASIQVLVNQLKEVVPTLQQSITELREEVDSASYAPAAADRSSGLQPAVHSQENKVVEAETIPSLHAAAAEQVYNTPALKLPHLFSLTPTSSSKGGTSQKRQNLSTPVTKSEFLPDYNHLDQPSSEGRSDNLLQDSCDSYALDLKRAVRKAAFSARPSSNSISLEENQDDVVEHYFVPLSRPPIFRHGFQQNGNYGVYKDDSDGLQDHFSRACVVTPDQNESKISWNGVNDGSHSRWYLQDLMDPQDQIFSPPLLMDSSFSPDAYEDLLAPFSEIDDAMMEH